MPYIYHSRLKLSCQTMTVRPLFTLCLFGLLAGQVSAQRFRAGLSGGLTVADIDGADTRDNDNDFHKVGFTAGALVNTQLTKKSLIQFEVNYIQKGSMQPPDSLNNGYYKIALQYVEIPVLIRRQIYFNYKGRRVNKVDLEGGVSYARLVHSTVIGNTNYVLSTAGNYFNTNEASVLLGVDYNFTRNIYFCFRYSNSVTPAVKRNSLKPGFVSYTFNRGNNMVFQFSFRVVFGGSREDAASKQPSPVQP